MKELILTEKPSVARDFAGALGVSAKGQGLFESDNYVITWAIGHLLELKAPEDYASNLKKWSLASLPILPDRLSYKPNVKTKKQLNIVKKQLSRKDLSKIIVATDAGREGELIARTLLMAQKSSAPMFRFWTSQALSKSVIQSELKNIKPLNSYDRLYYAGRARQSADWLVGMNLTRAATVKIGDLFSIGRVQTAVLSLLVQRRSEIDNFRPEKYFQVKGEFSFSNGNVEAYWFDKSVKKDATRIIKSDDAKAILDRCKGMNASVESIDRQKKSQRPPELFSLTELQRVANRVFGFSAKKTLSIAQDLYEKKKCLSYPRTDAKVLGTKALSQVKSLHTKFKSEYEHYYKFYDEKKVSLSNRLVFNDSKLTDHHALIPLKAYKGNSNSDEGKIYHLVLKRFIQAFSDDYIYSESRLTIKVTDNDYFKNSGHEGLHLGWKYLEGKSKDKVLPRLENGEVGSIKKLENLEKFTTPPHEYSEATLLFDMTNPARLVSEKELKKVFRGEVGLGTQATRAQIIETLIQRNYISREGKALIAKHKGVHLIKTLSGMNLSSELASPSKTARWEIELSNIAFGEGDPRKFMIDIRSYVANCVNEWKEGQIEKVKKDSVQKEQLGSCPICSKPVTEGFKSYSCESWKEGCKFSIWKKIAGKKISPNLVKVLLSKGHSKKLKGFKSKANRPFEASLRLENGEVKFDF